ncbi:hypothetical protein BEL04_14090 [Mucilaginibacter sp. PPCGB 2223]|uniref:hypothetical protein n=1 Tax=Mucilaginibacter sp. PPCGB 2223 TaxID=1886027 RepID=UPI000825A083|nr:hypothetical protein [Mucilaginibacter sp. PPCGB 2223]OCX52578.1 hypothetical protein BEL04_14090 [Mucilaginibacter sp. PPCGB 2223]
MKKIIITAIAATTVGMVASCTKNSGIQPASVQSQSVASDKSDVGSGDSAGGSALVSGGASAPIVADTTKITKSKKGR